jgi:hypothetical protein
MAKRSKGDEALNPMPFLRLPIDQVSKKLEERKAWFAIQ